MSRRLLDTDILSEIIKGKNAAIAARAGRYRSPSTRRRCWRLAGRISADLERAGRVIGMTDVMVAAIALRGGVPVVTGNVAHFEQVRTAGYQLVIENWRTG